MEEEDDLGGKATCFAYGQTILALEMGSFISVSSSVRLVSGDVALASVVVALASIVVALALVLTVLALAEGAWTGVATALARRRDEDQHCKSCTTYGRRAAEAKEALLTGYPNASFLINPTKPRSKAFDISFTKETSLVPVWSGRTLGPPRRLKFPSATVLLTKANQAIAQ
ncbi:hypothetical protein BJ684DRAFT_21568 [Piptocephalis cylindrospora]|uniref:Uncharacterized protein n=1 Tax=Piptocephalis cylindrospora TaxID=1907219 RepID=A0A4P9XZE6_9FUNG|nr:hypothetical protein BJ684DRAFT_21568 [Piptocephalis cylindrospora]|eukprot:RKP11858.1 hypothetical protein BJ684DRAFT_21568 [Piptocephalis cylindrospora]